MNDKKLIVESQAKFSKLHTPITVLLLIYFAVSLLIGNEKDFATYLPGLIDCVLIFFDLFFATKMFFNNYAFLKGIRIADMIISGIAIGFCVNTSYVGLGVLLCSVIVFVMFCVEFAFSSIMEELSKIFLYTSFTLIPGIINVGVSILMTESVSGVMIAVRIISAFLVSICFFAIFRHIGSIQKRQTESLLAKERLLDKANDNARKIEENQKVVYSINEQLGIKRFELEEANKLVRKINAETNLQNEILEKLSASMSLDDVFGAVNGILCKTFNFFTAQVLFKNTKLQQKYSYDFNDVFEKDDAKEIMRFFLSSAFINMHVNLGDLYINNNVDYDELPFFRNNNIKSIAAKTLSKNKDEVCIYICMSRDINAFVGKEKFFDNIFTQISITTKNLFLYTQMENLSKIDGLSNLYNRRYMNIFFDENYVKKSKNKVVSAVMCDIDHFKNINDTFGHLFGDQAIMFVANQIKKVAEKNDGIAFRYGGEEFVVLLDDKDENQAYKICETLRKTIEQSVVEYGEQSTKLTISIGVASFPSTTDDMHVLVDRADKAMYYSKEHGRNRCTIDSEELNS